MKLALERKPFIDRFLFTMEFACTLSACASRDINPESAPAEERICGVYDALRSVTPGTTKLVFHSRGAGHGVSY